MRGRIPLSEETLTKGGSTGPAAPPTGPRTPVATQDPAASSGALHAAAARIRTPSPAGRRHRPSPSWPGRASAATTAASTRPAAAIASEIPGQPVTRLLASSVVSSIRLTATETSRPSMATDQPAMTRNRRAVSSSAASAARARPPVTQNGGRPGPPGDSSSSDRAGRAAVASPGTLFPASRKSRDGWVATCSVHGSSRIGGTTTVIPRLSSVPRPDWRKATAATSAARTAMTQISGTKAAAIAMTRPAAQAARRARRGASVKIRAASSAISGMRAKTTAEPKRPAATAPMPTGSRA